MLHPMYNPPPLRFVLRLEKGGGGVFAGHYGTNTMPHQLHLEGHLMHNEQSHIAVLYKCRQQYAMYVFRSTHHSQI